MNEIIGRATKVMVIRHAEKPTDSPPACGVTFEGEREKESLTVRGWQRAGALACLFAPAAGLFPESLAEPRFLYASKPVRHGGSRRPLETLAPLADKLALRVNTDFRRSEAAAMLEDALHCAGVVLVCWQREFIPEIANRILGDETTAPQDWPDDRYDVVWVFDRDDATARYTFRQVPQRLLMGDRVVTIK